MNSSLCVSIFIIIIHINPSIHSHQKAHTIYCNTLKTNIALESCTKWLVIQYKAIKIMSSFMSNM